MIALLQRVKRASVEVDGVMAGQINPGLLVFLCAEKWTKENAEFFTSPSLKAES